jgi:hypothetical protein
VPVSVLTKVSNSVADDISKQTVAALLTILASVVSFYFGTRAGEGKKAGGTARQLRERAVEEITFLAQEARRLSQAIDQRALQRPMPADSQKRYESVKVTIAEASGITGRADASLDQLTRAAHSARAALSVLRELAE